MNNEKETNFISGVVNASNVEDYQFDEDQFDEMLVDNGSVNEGQFDEMLVDNGSVNEGQFDEMLVDKDPFDERPIESGTVEGGSVDEVPVDEGTVEGRVPVAEERNGAEKEVAEEAKKDGALLDGDIVERIIGGVVERMASVLRNDATKVVAASEAQAGAMQTGNAQPGAIQAGNAYAGAFQDASAQAVATQAGETQAGETQVRRCSTPNFLSDIRPDFWDRV